MLTSMYRHDKARRTLTSSGKPERIAAVVGGVRTSVVRQKAPSFDCHSGLDPESSLFGLDFRSRLNACRDKLIDGDHEGYPLNPVVVDVRTEITTELLTEEGYSALPRRPPHGASSKTNMKNRESEETHEVTC